MIKFGAFIPICFVMASGCALSDNQEMTSETPVTSVPIVENEPVPPAPMVEIVKPKVVEPAAVPPPSLTSKDIRRLQTRLREVGLDPGPVDGLAGVRTKAAYLRLHAGCSKVGPLPAHLQVPVTGRRRSAAKQTGENGISPEETQKLQGELRDAGFNPGPVDGIFGSRTQSAIGQFQSGCLITKEFEAMLDDSWHTIATETAVARPQESSLSPSANHAVEGTPHSDADHGAAVGQPVGASEEVRILQLRLRDAGFDPGPFDGLMGPKTRSALAQYEASQRGKKIKTSLTNATVTGHY